MTEPTLQPLEAPAAAASVDGDRLSRRNLFAFSLGGVGRDMVYGLYNSFLLAFILFTRQVTDAQFAAISMIIVFSRIFDALNDPVMGAIIENTRTRWGKFKPWIFAGALSCSVVIVTIFASSFGGWGFIAFLAVIYIMFSLTYTMNDISYWGMLPSLSSHPHDRNRLTSLAVLCAGAGGAVISVVVPTFTAGSLTIGSSAGQAYLFMAIITVVMFIGCQTMTVLCVKEKPLPKKKKKVKFSFKRMFKVIARNDQLMWCSLIFILYNIGNGVVGGGLSMTYIYFEFGYNGFLLTVFGVLGGVMQALINLFYPGLSKRFQRKNLMFIAILCIVFGYAGILAAGAALPSTMGMAKFAVLAVFNGFVGAGQGVFYIVLMVMIANTVEYNEWKFGEREEGLIYSMRPFTAKFGSALMQLVVMFVYIIVGVTAFTNKISTLENDAGRGLIDGALKAERIQEVTESVPQGKKLALLICMTLIPIVLITAGYLVFRKKYILDEATYEQMLVDIKARKVGLDT